MRRGALLVTILFGSAACVRGNAQLNTRRPIERANGYRQGGERLAADDMLNKIGKIKKCSGSASAAETLPLVAAVMGGVAGALIGFPLGARLTSDESSSAEVPLYVTGGILLTIGIVLEVVASSQTSNAVDCYNDHLGARESRRTKRSRRKRAVPRSVERTRTSSIATPIETTTTSSTPPAAKPKTRRKVFQPNKD